MIRNLLPRSVLHPPHHNITLPFTTSNLKVHDGNDQTLEASNASSKGASSISATALPLPHVHYAPLSIKGITTTAPVDGNARKQKRLAEVRQKRVEVKERKRELRRQEIMRGIKGQAVDVNGRRKKGKKEQRVSRQ